MRSAQHAMRLDTAALVAAARHSDDAAVHTTPDGEIVGWTGGAERMFGYTAAEAIGRSLAFLYPRGGWPGKSRYAESCHSARRQFEAVLLHRSGASVAVRATVFPVTDDAGEAVGIGTLFRDIAEQRRAERQLSYKSALADLLQTLVHVASETESAETALAEGLRVICEHSAWQLGHAVVFAPQVGRRVQTLSLWHTHDVPRYSKFIERAGAFDYSSARHGFLGRVFGSKAPVWVTDLAAISTGPRTGHLLEAGIRSGFAFPIIVSDEIMAIVEFFGVEPRPPDALLLENVERVSRCLARMIERQRAGAETARLAAIVEGANDAIIGRSLDGGIITSWNPAAERLLGYAADEAIGQPMAMTLPPERAFLVEANNVRLRRGEPIEIQETQRIRKDGTLVHVSANVSPVRNASGRVTGAAVIIRDISELVRTREQLERKVQLNALLQSLARTVNEATTAEDALHACLRLIGEHGQWDFARLLRFDATGSTGLSSLLPIRAGSGFSGSCARPVSRPTGECRTIVPGLLDTQDAVWVEALDAPPPAAVSPHPQLAGMRGAFGFPVVLAGRTVAVLEFFSRRERPRDDLWLEHIVNVAGQLARVMERHRFLSDITRSEERLRAILDSEPACVKVIDAAGSILDMNRAGLEFLDAASVAEVEARGLLNVIAPEHRDKFRETMRRTLDGENCDLEFEIIGLKGSRRWVESRTAPFAPVTGGAVGMLAVTRDITDRKRAEDRLDHLAHHDGLTGLPNRGLFRDRAGVAIARARRRGESVGVMIVALDRFRKVNESLGYDAGDELLREVAARISSTLREVDTLARLGADEFAILVEGGKSDCELQSVAERVQSALATPVLVKDREVFVTASIGIASCPADASDAQGLLDSAERAMNRVKKDGGAGYLRSEGPRATTSGADFGIEGALRGALRDRELRVHYQPKISLKTGEITGAEALLRWTSRDLGEVSPARFIPIAEDTGLILPIGCWVLETACAQAAAWQGSGRMIGISVNLSPRQFRQHDLVQVVARALRESGLPPGCLELEITESTAMSNPGRAAQVLGELHALGVRLSVDDFGTGYSSLSYLREFPLDCLKIDRSFVDNICTSSSDEAIVRATIALAHSLQLYVVAEGVETQSQHERLTGLGCDQGQGFLYSAAVPAADFDTLLRGWPAAR